MKINYNYHTHTRRCGHAVGTDEEYVVNAIKAGIKILGFSDHAPYKEPNPSERMNYNQYGDYVASIEHLREKYKDQIKILLGLEIEYFPSQIEDLVSYRNKMDYLILGQHMSEIDGRNNYYIKKPYVETVLNKIIWNLGDNLNSYLYKINQINILTC